MLLCPSPSSAPPSRLVWARLAYSLQDPLRDHQVVVMAIVVIALPLSVVERSVSAAARRAVRWPKSSDARNVSGMALQLRETKGPSRLALARCIALVSTVLSVPVSPWIKMGGLPAPLPQLLGQPCDLVTNNRHPGAVPDQFRQRRHGWRHITVPR